MEAAFSRIRPKTTCTSAREMPMGSRLAASENSSRQISSGREAKRRSASRPGPEGGPRPMRPPQSRCARRSRATSARARSPRKSALPPVGPIMIEPGPRGEVPETRLGGPGERVAGPFIGILPFMGDTHEGGGCINGPGAPGKPGISGPAPAVGLTRLGEGEPRRLGPGLKRIVWSPIAGATSWASTSGTSTLPSGLLGRSSSSCFCWPSSSLGISVLTTLRKRSGSTAVSPPSQSRRKRHAVSGAPLAPEGCAWEAGRSTWRFSLRMDLTDPSLTFTTQRQLMASHLSTRPSEPLSLLPAALCRPTTRTDAPGPAPPEPPSLFAPSLQRSESTVRPQSSSWRISMFASWTRAAWKRSAFTNVAPESWR
mmetsp:Transcript_110677/g.238196  ORF Transcript_110677/g.238196 Transcript_110677/m.238196 type:complete len:369 (-) Transcript_110677:280-1386(-)